MQVVAARDAEEDVEALDRDVEAGLPIEVLPSELIAQTPPVTRGASVVSIVRSWTTVNDASSLPVSGTHELPTCS